MEKVRIDLLMEELKLVESRSQAQRLIMAGQVRADGEVVLKPAQKFDRHVKIEVEQPPRFVSRGGEKLEGAIQAFGLTDLTGKICADIGASTGGFTIACCSMVQRKFRCRCGLRILLGNCGMIRAW
jgi:23S rRNA (cytidine1920-2'-O)/16S rRNA (cytidine1409-2'-O)-methyltransferase